MTLLKWIWQIWVSLWITWVTLYFLYSSLPAFDKDTKEKVDKDIESARKWIKEYL